MDKAEDDTQKGVAAVNRAIAILSAFDHRNSELDLADLARITELYKSTILRLLDSLMQARLVARLPNGRYVLDVECGRFGAVYRATRDPSGEIRAQLQKLADETGLTAGYFVRHGEHRVCIVRAAPPEEVFHHLNEGDRLALRQGAAGRLLCAHTGIELDDSAKARKDGFLFRHGDRFPELSSLATPVHSPSGQFHGVISLSGRTSVFSEDRKPQLVALLKDTAARLAGHLQPAGI